MRGKLFDLGGGSAMPLYGQKVRGLTTLKLAKVIQFMKDWRILGAALQETWRVTKDGVEIEETPDGYLIIHHGEANQNCKRGRNGVLLSARRLARPGSSERRRLTSNVSIFRSPSSSGPPSRKTARPCASA